MAPAPAQIISLLFTVCLQAADITHSLQQPAAVQVTFEQSSLAPLPAPFSSILRGLVGACLVLPAGLGAQSLSRKRCCSLLVQHAPEAGGGIESGGLRPLIPTVARACVAAGVDGLFLEVGPLAAPSPCSAYRGFCGRLALAFVDG